MADLKITIDQLKNYLGTGLKFLTSKHQIEYGKTHELTLNGISIDSKGYLNIEFLYDDDLMFSNAMNKIFPICYRLSDLDKFIPELGLVPIEELNKTSLHGLTIYRWESKEKSSLVFDTAIHGYNILSSFEKIQLLFQWNFWPFGDEYFTEGLVIDKLRNNGE